jgi:hypothetical protein
MSKKIKKSAKKLNKQLGSGAVILFMVAITIVSI